MTRAARPQDSLLQALARHARERADAIALVDAGTRLDFGKLWTRVERTASALHGAGVRAGNRVAIVLPNSVDAIAAVYGAWRLGAVAVPLNVQARAAELAPLLQHCAPRSLVHDPHHRDHVAAAQVAAAEGVRVLGAKDLQADHPASALPDLVPADDRLAQLLYTSGTTGSPKAVMLSQRNLAANVASIVEYLGLTAADSVVAVLPFNYSYGSSVLHTHLYAGARVVLERNSAFPQAIVDTLVRERATGFSGVPSTYALLLARSKLASADLASLRYVTLAGAAANADLLARLRAALPRTSVVVMYGQTEATARLAHVPPDRLDDKAGSAGRAIPGVQFSIRDEHGRELPPYTSGDLWVAGPNVMLGYWRDEAATSAVLVDGWLRTGDVGHVDEDGYLFLAGRRGDIIKTGAHRVLPLEIEEAIASAPGVREVAVVGLEDDLLGQVVGAFVVAEPGATPDPDRIRAHCRERLATYKVPKHVVFVDTLPRTESGKLRRFELAARFEESA